MNSDTLFSIIETFAIQHGRTEAESACKKFLRMKRDPGVTIKRKAIPRLWVDKAYVDQDGNCQRCGEPMKRSEATGDHKIALAQGGKHNKWNIVALHKSCNSSKGANSLIQESKKGHGTILEQLQR